MNQLVCKKLLVITFLLFASNIFSQTLAFPTAEGFGKFSKGGRGGKVYEVTTLADSGVGSFRSAFTAYPGEPLTIVFRVGGIIDLLSPIKVQRSNMTIAGQTAPGDGICFKRSMVKIYGTNVIVRYLRFRPGDVSLSNNPAVYGLDMENSTSFIVDHCSMSWSIEEAATFYDNKFSTVQWCIVSESLNASYNSKGPHGYAGVWGGQFATYHHNLVAHHHSRAVRFDGSRTHDTLAYLDYRNNVVYNWGNSDGCYGNEIEIADTGKPIFALRKAELNMVNNYYKPGPATPISKKGILLNAYDTYVSSWANRLVGKVYMNGNYVDGVPTVTANNYLGLKLKYYPSSFIDSFKLAAPTINEPIVMETAQNAYNSVLANAGAILPKRDTIDRRIVNETATGTATFHSTSSASSYYNKGNLGIIDTQDSIGGWPYYDTAAIAPIDTDHDGMPDFWENMKGLDSSNPNDRNDTLPNGYTRLEEYLNSIPVSNPLPLKLISFNAQKQNSANLLSWAIENNVEQINFIVEKSNDGIKFKAVGSIFSNNKREYDFIDIETNNSSVFYRIKMIDKEGKIIYSPTILISSNKKNKAVKVYPNPLQSQSWLSIAAIAAENVNLIICDVSGKIIWEQIKPLVAGNNLISLPYEALSQGIFLLRIKGLTIDESIVLKK